MPPGLANACPRNRSGKKPPGGRMVGIIRGGIFLIRPNVILKNLVLVRPRRSQNTQPASVLLVVLTWQEMCGIGMQAGMINPMTSAWCGVAPGSALRWNFDHRPGTGSILLTGSASLIFVLPRTSPNPFLFVLLTFSLSSSAIRSSPVPINR